ncbi:MAG TPA: hybrid sensor histidine kinase/response regulator [Cyanobacteria bacterium UBA8803]|nr:hybrid sensor histidine kinase/response regulator [Cyanobacteria bacterium UBA9273]HBL60300.1 hybrid sensor histidine kinase/response regulator [Cyanobacteria bacterium UBA8803]
MNLLHILLLEDSLLDAELIQAHLTDSGIQCELVRVETRTDFLSAIAQHTFDLILADYSLPAFDGLSALEIAHTTCPDVPFIFVSATLGEELAIETLKRGATDYVLKQRLERLAPSVHRALREAKERTERQKAQAALEKLAAELEIQVKLAQQTAQRNANLQALTAALSEALTPVQAAEIGVQQGSTALNASASFIALLTDDNQTLEIVKAIGYPQSIVDPWLRFPLTASVPIADAIKLKQPIWLESREIWRQAYPHLASQYADSPYKAWAAIPLIVEGRAVGGIGLSFQEARTFSEEDCGFMLALARQCAQAIARARAYAAERKARAEAEAANRGKDEFLATLSHELRTPLNAVLGWTQLLRTRQLDPDKMARALETIDRNTRSLATLIEDILDVSRIMMGKLQLYAHSCDLVPVIEAAMEAVRPAAEAKTIQMNCSLDSSTGTVWGDPNRLQQVIWNLLSNAIKFTPNGGQVTVRLSRSQEELAGRSYAEIQVSDSGKGISPDFVPHVFDRFCQENSTSTRAYGGLGLGLAIVRYLVEMHQGIVEVSSPGEGLGATFTVRLPLWVTPKERPQSAVPITVGSSTQPNNPHALEGLQVLVVEDEADGRELIATLLKDCGAQVTAVESAMAALEFLSKSQVDLLISDIAMPDIDGYEFIRKLRALEVARRDYIPAVALTAYARESDRILALEAGFQVHLPKPVNPNKLITVLVELTGKGTPEQEIGNRELLNRELPDFR